MPSFKRAKGKLIYRKLVNIKGLDKPFEKECRFELKTGEFSINYPERIVKDNIVQISFVYGQSLKQLEQDYKHAVECFEMLEFDYKMVIMYQIEERGSYKDGSGEGFVFNWGVFRKIESKRWQDNYANRKYHFERGYGKKDNEYALRGSNIRDWKEIAWSEKAEAFFIELSKQVETIYHKLEYFVTKVDFEEINNIKLLNQ